MATVKRGDIVLVSLIDWVTGLDGHQYKAIYGRLKSYNKTGLVEFTSMRGLAAEHEGMELTASLIGGMLKLKSKEFKPAMLEGKREDGSPFNCILFL